MNMKTGISPVNGQNLTKRFWVRDPISALSHFVGFLLAIFAAGPLLFKGIWAGCSLGELLALTGFILGMIALYGASAAYHTFFKLGEKGYFWLKRLDHSMIYLLIVGSYLPICVFALWDGIGKPMTLAVSAVAFVGILFTLFWVTCPKWLSSCIYIALGWVSALALPQMLEAMSPVAIGWLVAGGLLYTVGGVIYALKLPGLERRFPGFGAHELFHLFVLAGTICHYIMVFVYLVG